MAQTWKQRGEEAWHNRTLILAKTAAWHGGAGAAKEVWRERRFNKKQLIENWIKRIKKKEKES